MSTRALALFVLFAHTASRRRLQNPRVRKGIMQFEQLKALGAMLKEQSDEADAQVAKAAWPSMTINSERVVVINAQTLNLDARAINRMMDNVAG